MNNKLGYYKWFQKIISVFIDIFFAAVPLASLYVLTSFLSGYLRLIAFALLIIAYILVIFYFKDKIHVLIETLLNRVDRLNQRKMFIIIFLTALIIKIIFTIFFNYDATVEGDVKIYNDIADQIIATGDIHSDAISHLYGVALHLVLFKLLGIPIHVGIFIVFLIGTLINYVSFSRIIGKNKAFLAIMIYLIMPSTGLLTFCPTHELFLYMYISLLLYAYNRLIKSESLKSDVFYSLLVVINLVLACFVRLHYHCSYGFIEQCEIP